jgi:hypothetical protein
MTRKWHAFTRLSAALLGLLAGLMGTEMVFGHLRSAEAQPQSTAVLYSIEVRNEAGDLLASPMVVGEENKPVHLDLSQGDGPHSEPLAMSLDLDPQPDGAGICLGYKLSIDDGFKHQGRMGVEYGQLRSKTLNGGGQTLKLSLVVARARTSEFNKVLAHRKNPAAT